MCKNTNLIKTIAVITVVLVFVNIVVTPASAEANMANDDSNSLITNVAYCYSDYLSDMKKQGFSDYEGGKLLFDTDAVVEVDQISSVDNISVATSNSEKQFTTFYHHVLT